MKTSTKLLIAGIILLLVSFVLKTALLFAIPCIGAAFILIIFQGIMEIINKNK